MLNQFEKGKLKLLRLCLLTSGMISRVAVLAQQNPPNPGGVPIDGGLSFLLAAGVGYGAKKAYDARKAKRADGRGPMTEDR